MSDTRTDPDRPERYSVRAPLTPAWERMKDVCFRPFSLKTWVGLGFVGFLGAIGFQLNNLPSPNIRTGNWNLGNRTGTLADWLLANLADILGWVAIGGVLLSVIVAAVLWIQSRAKFMFIDGVVNRRGLVVKPWKAYRNAGNSLWLFALILFESILMLFFLAIAIGVIIAWPDIEAEEFTNRSGIAITVVTSIWVILGFLYMLLGMIVENFIAPTMYVHQCGVLESWVIFKRECLVGHWVEIILFMGMKFLIVLCTTILGLFATCLTCCITSIPIVGTIITLPLLVYPRCYSLLFLEQFGPTWTFFRTEEDEGERCETCGYDLRGLTGSTCPECGKAFGEPAPPTTPPTEPA